MPFKPTEESSLRKVLKGNPKFEPLRTRAEKAGYDIGGGRCDECGARLTEADIDAGECQMCGTLLPGLEDRH